MFHNSWRSVRWEHTTLLRPPIVTGEEGRSGGTQLEISRRDYTPRKNFEMTLTRTPTHEAGNNLRERTPNPIIRLGG